MAAGTRSYAEFKRQSYFPALDGIRALSILLVLLHHVPDFSDGLVRTLQINGRYGVSFFFVVSGFLICTLLLRERERTGRIAWGKFYARRALRLLPLYYATLGLQCVLVFGLHLYSPENQELFRAKLPAYAFYFSNWLATATQGPFFYAWSLAVEEQFYLGFGLLLTFVPRDRWIYLLGIALLGKFAIYQAFGNVDVGSAVWRVLFSYQEAILLGVLLALALNNRATYDRMARGFRPRFALPGVSLAIAGWLWLHPMKSQSTWDAELLYVAMTLVVAGALVRKSAPLLTAPLFVHIGKISYGIYLLHTFVIYALEKLPLGRNPAYNFVVSAPLAVIFASLVYRAFERPIIDYYKRRYSPPSNVGGETAASSARSAEVAPPATSIGATASPTMPGPQATGTLP